MKARTKRIVSVLLMLTIVIQAVFGLVGCFGGTDEPEEPAKYTLTYSRGASDATGEIPAVESYEAGEEVTLKAATTFAREGYAFTVWSDGTETYEAGETFEMPAHDVTLTAQWEDNSTDITVNEVKFSNGNLVFTGKAGGGIMSLVAYLYDTNEGIDTYKSTPNIKSDRTFTASIPLSKLTAAPGNWYYLMVSVNGGAKEKVKYPNYNKTQTYDYGSRTYKWEYYEGIAVSYSNAIVKSHELDVSGTAVRAEKDGHVYLSVSGTYKGYAEQDFDMDIQLQGGTSSLLYNDNVSVTLSEETFKVKMDVSGIPANTGAQYYSIHLFVKGVSQDVGCNDDPWIVETSATDDGHIYKLKSDYVGWGPNKNYIMQLRIEQRGSQFTQADYLKVDGWNVKKNYGGGETVMLRGANAGGYLVSEQWMTAVDYKDYKTASKILENRFGEETMQDLWAYYRSYFWTDQDFKNCADMGMTAIRLPFTYMNVDYNQTGDYDFSALDDFVRGAAKYGIYTILDLHGAYGSQNGQDHSGEVIDGNVDFYQNNDNRGKTWALWSALAEHYSNNPAIAAFDILNEPGIKGGQTTQTQWDFYNELYQAIREKDSNRIVIFESCWSGSDLPSPSKYGWKNCIYSFHHYVGETDNNGNAYSLNQLKSKMAARVNDLKNMDFQIPLYMGEFTCYGNEQFWNYTLDLFEQEGWHWTSWTYKASWNLGGWSIYYNWANKPDLEQDSIYDIKEKWRGVSTAYASETTLSGTKLKDIFKSALK